MKNVVLLGSTGSIGIQAEKILRKDPDSFKIVGLAARGSNLDELARQARELKPSVVCVYDHKVVERLRAMVGNETFVTDGMEGIIEMCTKSTTNVVLNAMVGMVGLRPTLETLKSGKTLLLANKESVVAGGELVMQLVQEGAQMIPVDSEHSGLKMCLQGNEPEDVESVTIYASGGPFFGMKRDELASKTIDEALGHKTWKMGSTITIQSSTLANKGREVIEAMHMYGLKLEQVNVLVEPTSTYHASITYKDGATMDQTALPTMEIPIQYALYHPNRPKNEAPRLNKAGKTYSFYEPDRVTFKSLRLAEEAARKGGTMPAAFNGADERAVKLFLQGEIGYLDIGDFTEQVMEMHQKQVCEATLDNIIAVDRWARLMVDGIVGRREAIEA